LLLFCICASAEETKQAITLSEAKVHYSLEVIKHITWNNEKSFDHFTLGILGEDNKLIKAFKVKTATHTIRGKKVQLEQFDSLKDANKNYLVIFITRKNLDLVAEVNKHFKNALIISDGIVDNDELMVSLVKKYKKKNIQINIAFNRKNIVKRGFSISNNLLRFAGNKEDLSEQLREKEFYLNTLFLEARAKQEQLSKLNQSLAENNAELAESQLSLEEKINQLAKNQQLLKQNQEKLTSLKLERKLVSSALLKNTNEILKQQQTIESKQIEHTEQEQKLQQLKSNIEANESKLAKQITELKNQKLAIDIKEQTINNQRSLLYIALAIIVIFLLIKYSILRLSHMRKQANQELTTLNAQLYELATTDSMTNLYNRRHFVESTQLQIAQLKRTEQECALLMIDIDNFKTVNDNYGHAMGDQVIINIANILRENMRKYDIVGRLGGEEYAMFLTNSDLKKANKIAERLRVKVEELFISFQGNTVQTTISIGLTAVNIENDDIDHLLQRADKALYQAKESGRNQVVLL